MSWQERMRQMVLAGGVVIAGCSSSRLTPPHATGTGGSGPAAGGTGGTGGALATGGAVGAGGTPATGGAAGTGGTLAAGGAAGAGAGSGGGGTGGAGFPIPCGNANPDPCICGRPDASATDAALCAKKTMCVSSGGEWSYSPPGCSIDLDAGVDARRDGAQGAGGDGRAR
ncbi:MAG TPA: hypothetical protein VHO67_01600 [Polyangia bacterium]|nr:hypothetical protein [Polyangia bacterium]